MKLLVRNLARTTTEAELRTLFEAQGTVQSCSLVIDKKTGSIKWLSRTHGLLTTFVYMARQGPATDGGSSLRFSGSVTLRDGGASGTSISGSQVVPIVNYHWADTNQDNRIYDDEILEAYDVFSALDELDYDWQEIDDIWSGEGYHWDEKLLKYVILP